MGSFLESLWVAGGPLSLEVVHIPRHPTVFVWWIYVPVPHLRCSLWTSTTKNQVVKGGKGVNKGCCLYENSTTELQV